MALINKFDGEKPGTWEYVSFDNLPTNEADPASLPKVPPHIREFLLGEAEERLEHEGCLCIWEPWTAGDPEGDKRAEEACCGTLSLYVEYYGIIYRGGGDYGH